MSKIEFRPNIFSVQILMFLFTIVFSVGLLGVYLLPKAVTFYLEFPSDSAAVAMIIVLPLLLIVMVGLGVWGILFTKNRKIWIDGKLLYFTGKPFLQGNKNAVINLEETSLIGYREQVRLIFSGKALITVKHGWFVFEQKNNRKEEISIDGWDGNTLKNLLYYLKGKFSNIKINTPMYKDSSEELSGLSEYIAKK